MNKKKLFLAIIGSLFLSRHLLYAVDQSAPETLPESIKILISSDDFSKNNIVEDLPKAIYQLCGTIRNIRGDLPETTEKIPLPNITQTDFFLLEKYFFPAILNHHSDAFKNETEAFNAQKLLEQYFLSRLEQNNTHIKNESLEKATYEKMQTTLITEIIKLLEVSNYLECDILLDATINVLAEYLTHSPHKEHAASINYDNQNTFDQHIMQYISGQLPGELHNRLAQAMVQKTKGLTNWLFPLQPISELPVNDASCVAFSPEDQNIAIGTFNGAIKIWNIAAQQYMQTLELPDNNITSLAYHPSGRKITFATPTTVGVWDLVKETTQILNSPGNTPLIAYNTDGTLLAIAQKKIITIVSTHDNNTLYSLQANADVIGIAFNTDGTQLAAVGEVFSSGIITIWNLPAKEPFKTLYTQNAIRAIDYDPVIATQMISAESSLYTPSTITLWNISATNHLLHNILDGSFFADAYPIIKIIYNPNHMIPTFASASTHNIKIWDTQTGTCIERLLPAYTIQDITYNSAGSQLAIAHFGATIYASLSLKEQTKLLNTLDIPQALLLVDAYKLFLAGTSFKLSLLAQSTIIEAYNNLDATLQNILLERPVKPDETELALDEYIQRNPHDTMDVIPLDSNQIITMPMSITTLCTIFNEELNHDEETNPLSVPVTQEDLAICLQYLIPIINNYSIINTGNYIIAQDELYKKLLQTFFQVPLSDYVENLRRLILVLKAGNALGCDLIQSAAIHAIAFTLQTSANRSKLLKNPAYLQQIKSIIFDGGDLPQYIQNAIIKSLAEQSHSNTSIESFQNITLEQALMLINDDLNAH